MYLLCLLIGLTGLTVIDWRYQLIFFSDWRRAVRIMVVLIAGFVVWDLLGVALGIFFVGDSNYLTGLRLAPEFPLEELFFLSLLVYTALVIWRVLEVKWPRI